jgi:N-acetylmuramoyl-L-alanine amidase
MLFATLVAVSLQSAVALPIVAIDPGHGGDQEGAIGVCGAREKDITLAIGAEVARLLEASGKARALLTRTSDEAVSLEERAARANAAHAALLLSVHANASTSASARGCEAYFLSLNAADRRIAHLAAVENGGATINRAAKGTLGRILEGLRGQAVLGESQRLARLVEGMMNARLAHRGRGVLQAPFIVLKEAEVPAVLVEVGYLTNEEECATLADVEVQRGIAQTLAASVLAHIDQASQLDGPRVAMVERAP